jgi:ABC-2 type transport system permease protein
VRRFGRQLRAEQLLYWRNRGAAFFTFLLPLLLLGLLGVIGRDQTVEGRPYADYFVPGMLGVAVVMTTFAGLAITLTIRRERGILKRVRGTPLPAAEYLAALVASTALVLALEAIVVLAVGSLALGVDVPGAWWQVVLLVLLGAWCFAGLGIAVTRLVPSAEGSSAVVNAIYLPVLIVSGSFYPVEDLPRVLRLAAEALPLSHLLTALQDVFVDGGVQRAHLAGLGILVLWGLVGAVLAVRTFRWEPQS